MGILLKLEKHQVENKDKYIFIIFEASDLEIYRLLIANSNVQYKCLQ